MAAETEPTTRADAATSRREQRRQVQQELSRSQLLDAAEEVFGDKGFHEATLKEVAELAEFSVGSVYSFFDNKEDLYLSVLLRRGSEFLPGMEAAVASGDDPVAQLHALVDFEVGFFRRYPHFGRLYLHSAGSMMAAPEVVRSDELARNTDRALALHAGVFERGGAAGVLRGGSPSALARLLSGMVLAFQSIDPAGAASGRDGAGLELEELHELVDGAFVL